MFFVGLIAVLIVTISSLTLWWYFIYYKYKKYLKTFPSPTQFPILGILYKIRNTIDIYYDVETEFKKLGKNMFVMIGPFPTLFTIDPKLFSIVLGSMKHVNKPFMFNVGFNQLLSNALLIAKGNEWRRQRKLLSPAFDYKSIMDGIKIFNKYSEKLINKLKDEVLNESTDVVPILEDAIFDQSYETLLGDTEGVIHKVNMAKYMKKLLNIAIKRMYTPLCYFSITQIFTNIYWQERNALKIFNNMVREIIERKRKENCDLKIERKPLYIDILMNNNYSDEFIENQIKMGLVGAVDTTAITLSFILYNLAKYPDMQQTAFEEIYSILGEDIHQPITNQQVNEMKYLDLVIKESMRIYTTAPYFFRTLNEDVIYEDVVLPKGLIVVMVPSMMHVDPDIYPEPDKFIPERFLPENLNLNRYSYVPFNAGVRNCLGKLYAMVSMKILLAKLLLNYEFMDIHHQLCICVEITLQSKTGVRVGIRKRNLVKTIN